MSAGSASAPSRQSLAPYQIIINSESIYYQHVNTANIQEHSSHHPKYMHSNEKHSPSPHDQEHEGILDSLIIGDSITKGIFPKVFDKSRRTKIISLHGKRIEDGISYIQNSPLRGLNTIILHMGTNNLKNDNEEEIIISIILLNNHIQDNNLINNLIPDNNQKAE